MRRAAVVLIAALFLTGIQPSAQSPTALNQLLDKMASYLRDYESQLSSLVADEVFSQRVVTTIAFTGRLSKTETTSKRLESEVGFIRLPGGAEWLGFETGRPTLVRDPGGQDLISRGRIRVDRGLARSGASSGSTRPTNGS